MKRFDLSKFRPNSRNSYFDRFAFIRVLEISMSVEHSKCAGGVETIRLIGHSFRVLGIRWFPHGSKIEQNEKKKYISTFDHSSQPSLAFQGLLGRGFGLLNDIIRVEKIFFLRCEICFTRQVSQGVQIIILHTVHDVIISYFLFCYCPSPFSFLSLSLLFPFLIV